MKLRKNSEDNNHSLSLVPTGLGIFIIKIRQAVKMTTMTDEAKNKSGRMGDEDNGRSEEYVGRDQ